MERLTKRPKMIVNGEAAIPLDTSRRGLVAILNRLAAIEDILGDNYDLAHLRELVQAEKDGRLAVLPCKDGKVYTIEEDYFQCDSCEHKAKSYYHQDYKKVMCDNEDVHCPLFVKEHVTEGFNVSFKDGKTVLSAPGEWGYEGLGTFCGCDGKWYLTRKEAEAALNKEEHNG